MPRCRRSSISVTLVSVAITMIVLVIPACGLRHHTVKPRTGAIAVTPTAGKAGSSFALMASGFRPGEALTFEIDLPNKTKFVGPSHVADAQGTVSTTYVPLSGDPAGVYGVVAVGNEGTQAHGSLTVAG